MSGALHAFRLSRPRRSSDACLLVRDAAGEPLVGGVCDMIGRPAGLAWRHYARTAQRQIQRALKRTAAGSLDALCDTLRDEFRKQNLQIREAARRHDRSAFGFCAAFAARRADRFRVISLGDCRVYRLRAPPPGATGPFCCESLTRDHNALERAVRESGGLTLFRDEILRLGKRLDVFLGADPRRVEEVLRAEGREWTLGPRELLLLVSDGVYVPLLRALMDRTVDRMGPGDLYLESFLAEWLSGRPEAGASPPPWERWVRRLVRDAESYAALHPAYRDDMAAMGWTFDAPE